MSISSSSVVGVPMTKDEIRRAHVFHVEGVRTGRCQVWRRNGNTQEWKRDLDRFEVPVKYGLRGYDRITNTSPGPFYSAEACPMCDAARQALAARDEARNARLAAKIAREEARQQAAFERNARRALRDAAREARD